MRGVPSGRAGDAFDSCIAATLGGVALVEKSRVTENSWVY